ncbi:MAG: DUF92 domain-containing protein [Candidatus Aquilonibacter sp.]
MTRVGLSRSGAIAAVIVGIVVLGIGGWRGAVVLFAFFIPSTLLSHVGRARKREFVDIGKQGARDAWQVGANGGVATLAMLASLHYGPPMLAAFAGALAAASADTWATEIGTLARGEPRSILTFRPLATGLSGGITLQGSLAQLGGAALIALVALSLHVAPFWPVFAGGVIGSIADSVLGATLQALRYCPQCRRDCETNPHVCGTPTVIRRGLSWFDNDAVNFAATICGAAVAYLLR